MENTGNQREYDGDCLDEMPYWILFEIGTGVPATGIGSKNSPWAIVRAIRFR